LFNSLFFNFLKLNPSSPSQQLSSVPSDPTRPLTRSNLMRFVSLPQETSVLSTCSSKTSSFSLFLVCSADPVHVHVVLDLSVVGIKENDFLILKFAVCTYPLTVEDSETA